MKDSSKLNSLMFKEDFTKTQKLKKITFLLGETLF
jgi:hypothetical protein